MNQTSVSHADTPSYNPENALIPENVKGNPHMFRGWREGLLWAMINPRLLEEFERETCADIDRDGRGLGAFISPEHGLQVAELCAFVAWFNRTVWEPEK